MSNQAESHYTSPHAALATAQSEFEAAFKDATNPHFRSSYASLDACISAVRPALNKNGFYLLQRVEESGEQSIVKVTTEFIYKDGTVFTMGTVMVPSAKNDAQGIGSALTYARRYGLLAAAGIAPEDDDGNAASGKDSSHIWFAEKMMPLVLRFLKEGTFKRGEETMAYTPERANLLITSFLTGKIGKEDIINQYNNYKDQL